MKNNTGKFNNFSFGRKISISLSIATILTFIVAMFAIPISGAFCPENCLSYPFLNTIGQYPNDFVWMYFAIVMLSIYLVFTNTLSLIVDEDKKIFSKIAVQFSGMSALVLIVNYFIQATVIPASLASGHTEGLPLLIQYNAHGLFIALEDIGYLLMSVSFLFVGFALNKSTKLESKVKSIFTFSPIIVFLSFIVMSFMFGLDLQDRFEVLIILVNWLVLIVTGFMMAKLFKNKIKEIN